MSARRPASWVLVGLVCLTMLSACEPPKAARNSGSSAPAAPPPPPSATSPTGSPAPVAPPAPSPAPAGGSAVSADLLDVKPDFTLSAVDLGKENEADSDATNAKYAGKVIEVEGIVVSYSMPAMSPQHVSLGTPENGLEFVQAQFSTKDVWKRVARGSKVKVKGRWKTGKPDSFVRSRLEDCVFTEVGPNPRIVTTAEKLSAEARADREQFRSRYSMVDVAVQGEVEGVQQMEIGRECVVLKTPAAPKVAIVLLRFKKPGTPKLQDEYPPGMKVTLLGQYNDIHSYGKEDVYLGGVLIPATQ